MDWIHTVMQQAQQQVGDVRLVLFGHISSYDPQKHAVKVIIPAYRDETGAPLETSWIPLGTLAVGNGFGVQYAPHGGASANTPGNGEQVQVLIFNRATGLMAVAQMCFNDLMLPPGNGDTTPDATEIGALEGDPHGRAELKSGELIIRHKSGAFLKFYDSGTVQLFTHDAINLVAEKDVNVIANDGDVFVDAFENVDIQSGQDANLTSGGSLGLGAVAEINSQALNIKNFAAQDIRTTAGRGLTLAAGFPEQIPQDKDIVMRAQRNLDAEVDGDASIWAAKSAFFTASTGGVQISTGAVLTNPLNGNIDIDAAVTVNLISFFDVNAHPNRDFLVQAQTGKIVLRTANETVSSNSANDIQLLADDDIRLRARSGLSLASGLRQQDPAANDIDIMANNHLRLQTNSGGIAIGALQDPRSFLLSGDIYWSANGVSTIESIGGSTGNLRIRSTNFSVSIYTGSSVADATGNNIKISALGNLDLATRNSGTNVTITGIQDITLSAGRDIRNLTTTYFGVSTGGASLTGNSGEIQLNASGSVNIRGQSSSGTITIFTNNVSTVGAVKIGNGSDTTYQLLTKYLWDNFFVNHVHSGVTAGGSNTGGPVGTPSMAYPYCTDTVQAN